MEPNVDDVEINFSENFDADSNLDGLVEGSMYYSLDGQYNGYNAEEGCLIIGTPMTDNQIAETTGSIAYAESLGTNAESTGSVAQGNGIPDAFTGLIAFQGGGESCGSVAYGESGESTGSVAHGESGESAGSVAFSGSGESCGSIAFDYQTQGNSQLSIKIGNADPVMLASSTRTTANIPFRLKDDTFILIYSSAPNVAAARFRSSVAASTDCVKLFGIKFSIDGVVTKGDVNGDGSVTIGDIVAVVNIIAGNTGNYNLDAADANKDGTISVGDIVTIVNIISGND